MSVNERMNEIAEAALISSISSILPRSGYSVNKTHTSDSEILDVGLDTTFLAATTDIISEEITQGLYTDPNLIGWMSMVVNLSDLAAVGAKPIGMLMSMTVSTEWKNGFIEQVVQGMAEACRAHGCGSVGGDYNTGVPALGATALGLVAKNRVMKRTGIQPGDLLYVTGPMGLGNAFVAMKLVFPDLLETYPYKPKARIEEGQIISKYASSCMDTSDGFIFTVDTLYRLNSVAFRIEDPKSFCHPAVTAVGQLSGMPPLFFLSGIHGEFELCFTIPPDREDAFLAEMAAHGFTPVKAGTAVADIKSEKGIFIEGKRFPGTDVRNLWERSSSKEEYSMNLLGLINDFIKLS